MALLVQTWDLPIKKTVLEWYAARGSEWVPSVLRQPGVVEFRAYRNPLHASPEVMTHTEFTSMADLQAWLGSDEYRRIIGELHQVGCTNLTVAVWDSSPIVPEPRRPR